MTNKVEKSILNLVNYITDNIIFKSRMLMHQLREEQIFHVKWTMEWMTCVVIQFC